MNSSTRLVYKNCSNDGTIALNLAEVMWSNKLVTGVSLYMRLETFGTTLADVQKLRIFQLRDCALLLDVL